MRASDEPVADAIREAYGRAFLEYLAHGGEAALQAGYELGREAVRDQLSVMDLAAVHHAVLASVLRDPPPGIRTERVTRSAAEFFLEGLSAFEMVQRGFWEATETARLEKEHGVRLRRLAEASLAINSTLSLRGILQVAVDRSRQLIGAGCAVAAVSVGERDPDQAEAISTSGPAEAWTMMAKSAMAAWSRAPLPRPTRMTGQEVGSDAVWNAIGPHAMLGAPLLGPDGRGLGLVVLLDKEDGEFSESDESVLAQLASVTSVAVANAHLYERERNIAEALQRRLLPGRLPDIPGVAIAALYVPGAAGTYVGGDWYDVICLPRGRVGVAVGDVLGRGADAAALMGQVRTAFRAYALGGEAPEVVVARLDGLIQAMDIGHFSTMVYLVLDPASGEMQMVQAGHPPPMLLDPAGQTRYLEGSQGMALGVLADGEYERVVESLAVGSTLVLYTDGLVESREGIGSGLARLEGCMRSLAGSTDALSSQCGRLLRQMVQAPAEDDVAVLMLRLEPVPNPLRAS